MNARLIQEIADAVLYEGYLLYPYRASAIKNRQRWNFGVLYPRAYAESQTGSDTWTMQTECLLRASPQAAPSIRTRFLHLLPQSDPGQAQRAAPREVSFHGFSLSALANAARSQSDVGVTVEAKAQRLSDDVFRLRVRASNSAHFNGSTREEALERSLVSTHLVLGIDDGEFVSLLEPPDELRDAAAACKNEGLWPVLVGEDGERDAMLASPIILYDYPKIAPESPGALFDGAEIDEILTLRILTMTDREKAEMAQTDERTREILRRTESMPPEQLMKLHGVLRDLRVKQAT